MLISLILVPLVLGIIQLGLVLHVRHTLAAAATEGARYAATADRGPEAGEARTRQQITGALASKFAESIHSRMTMIGGVAATEVRVTADVPPLGLWGPPVHLSVGGHGIEEQP